MQINTIRKKYHSLPLSYDVPPCTIKKSHSSDGRDSKVDNKHQPLANGKILSKPTSHYSNIYSVATSSKQLQIYTPSKRNGFIKQIEKPHLNYNRGQSVEESIKQQELPKSPLRRTTENSPANTRHRFPIGPYSSDPCSRRTTQIPFHCSTPH